MPKGAHAGFLSGTLTWDFNIILLRKELYRITFWDYLIIYYIIIFTPITEVDIEHAYIIYFGLKNHDNHWYSTIFYEATNLPATDCVQSYKELVESSEINDDIYSHLP